VGNKINAISGNLEKKEDALITYDFGSNANTYKNLLNHAAHSRKIKSSSKITKKANFQTSKKNYNNEHFGSCE
jgi:hypothetical protein